jgi:hypothetical protein
MKAIEILLQLYSNLSYFNVNGEYFDLKYIVSEYIIDKMFLRLCCNIRSVSCMFGKGADLLRRHLPLSEILPLFNWNRCYCWFETDQERKRLPVYIFVKKLPSPLLPTSFFDGSWGLAKWISEDVRCLVPYTVSLLSPLSTAVIPCSWQYETPMHGGVVMCVCVCLGGWVGLQWGCNVNLRSLVRWNESKLMM